MRTPAQRGPVGNWLRDERLARGWTSAAVARRNLDRAGIRVAASVYAEWESGTRIPSERQQEALEAFYGSKPAGTTAGGEQSALVAALTAQTEALNRVADRLDLAAATWQGTAEAIGPLLDALRESIDLARRRDVREQRPPRDVVQTGQGQR